MHSLQSVKTRIKATKNIAQLAEAMEVVAANKMRRAQTLAVNARPYAEAALGLLVRLGRCAPVTPRLAERREVRKTLLVVVSSDRGLIGAFNSQVSRFTEQYVESDNLIAGDKTRFLIAAIGKKAIQFSRKKDFDIAQSFLGFGEFAEPEETNLLSDFVISGFLNGQWDRTIFISTRFLSALLQSVEAATVLPINLETELRSEENIPSLSQDYIFEPSVPEIIESVVPHLVKTRIYHLILEANASEHSARRLAMKNASDNAGELLKELAIHYNKARQAAITREVVEIVAGSEALQV